ncbi:hypothetical protein HDV01_001831 [Terramyces sp. JEL0728]|nr:hypothetical protein HDV01_001831 [Terramyces sp. JEL0728]
MNWKLIVLFAARVISQGKNSSAVHVESKTEAPPPTTTIAPTTANPPPTTTNPPATTQPQTQTNAPTTQPPTIGVTTESATTLSSGQPGFATSTGSPDPSGDTGNSNASPAVVVFGWVVLAVFIAGILAAAGWFFYRHYRKKNRVIQDKNLDEGLEYTPAEHLFAPRPSSAILLGTNNLQKTPAQSSPLAASPVGSDSSNSARNSYIVPKAYPPIKEESPYAPPIEEEATYGHYYEGKDYGSYSRNAKGPLYTYAAESVPDGDYEANDPDARFPNKDTLERVISEPSETGAQDDGSSEPISDSDELNENKH